LVFLRKDRNTGNTAQIIGGKIKAKPLLSNKNKKGSAA
jgi:hypothetical protein